MDTISAVGSLSTKKTFSNKTKLLYSTFVSLVITISGVPIVRWLISSSSNKLLDTYLLSCGFSGVLCSAVLIMKLSFRSENKYKALLEVELVHSAIKKHSISVSKCSALDFCKEVCFITLLLNVVLDTAFHGLLLFNAFTASEFDKNQLLGMISSQLQALFYFSMQYSFTMLTLLSLESFSAIKEEILATMDPKNLTLSINKVLPPVDQVENPVFTIGSQSHGGFKDIRSKHIRSMIKCYCLLEEINIFTNYWHSGPTTCVLTAVALYFPTIPVDQPKSGWSLKLLSNVSLIQFSLFSLYLLYS